MPKENKTGYDQKYNSDDYYWGKKPSSSALLFLDRIKLSTDLQPTLIDLGAGEGRDAVYFARHGLDVTAVDISKIGLSKTKNLANEQNVSVETVEANIIDYKLTKQYDVIFSSGTMHYLPSEIRAERFEHLKKMTKPGGYNLFLVFVEKPFIEKAPDAEDTAYFFKSGELLSYYWDWEIINSSEEIFNCNSGGTKHKHAFNRIIAKKITV